MRTLRRLSRCFAVAASMRISSEEIGTHLELRRRALVETA